VWFQKTEEEQQWESKGEEKVISGSNFVSFLRYFLNNTVCVVLHNVQINSTGVKHPDGNLKINQKNVETNKK